MEIRDTSIGYFPGVRFTRGYCTGEHGDPISGIVAIDSDSVLYQLGSQEALDFLLIRHPIPRLDSTAVLDYAVVALELTGHSSAHSRLVTAVDSAVPELRSALRDIRGQPVYISAAGQPRPSEWRIYFGRSEPAYEGRHYFYTEIWITHDGRATVIGDSMVTRLPAH